MPGEVDQPWQSQLWIPAPWRCRWSKYPSGFYGNKLTEFLRSFNVHVVRCIEGLACEQEVNSLVTHFTQGQAAIKIILNLPVSQMVLREARLCEPERTL